MRRSIGPTTRIGPRTRYTDAIRAISTSRAMLEVEDREMRAVQKAAPKARSESARMEESELAHDGTFASKDGSGKYWITDWTLRMGSSSKTRKDPTESAHIPSRSSARPKSRIRRDKHAHHYPMHNDDRRHARHIHTRVATYLLLHHHLLLDKLNGPPRLEGCASEAELSGSN